MASAPFSLRLDDRVKSDLAFLAKATKRSKSSLAAEVLETTISARASRLRDIQAAKQAANKGGFISHESMKAWAHSLGTSSELPAPTQQHDA